MSILGVILLAGGLDWVTARMDVAWKRSCQLKAEILERIIALMGREAEKCVKGLEKKRLGREANVANSESEDCGLNICKWRSEAWMRASVSSGERGGN